MLLIACKGTNNRAEKQENFLFFNPCIIAVPYQGTLNLEWKYFRDTVSKVRKQMQKTIAFMSF